MGSLYTCNYVGDYVPIDDHNLCTRRDFCYKTSCRFKESEEEILKKSIETLPKGDDE